MKTWVQQHKNRRCQYVEHGEEKVLVVFDWSEIESKISESIGDVFGDSMPGDFDGLWTGDAIDSSEFVPFGLANVQDELLGTDLSEETFPQFDAIFLYKRGDNTKAGRVYAIDVDGTANPSLGVQDVGTLVTLGIPDGAPKVKKKMPSKKQIATALAKAQAMFEGDDGTGAVEHLEAKLSGLVPHSYDDFDTATDYGACFLLRGHVRWRGGDAEGAIADWKAAAQNGRSISYIRGAVLYLVASVIRKTPDPFDVDDHYKTAVSIPATQGVEIVDGVFEPEAVNSALDTIEGRDAQVDAIRAWFA